MRRILIALLLTVATTIFGALPASAQSGQRCFPETNQCIEGRFREYWEANGGLAVFGFPIATVGEQYNVDLGRNVLTQQFERNRFELHPENARPYDVLLGRLGADALRAAGVDWQAEPRGTQQAGCLWFAETQHSVCDQVSGLGFQSYWRSHGLEFDGKRGVSYAESLALFGLPLTEPRMETNSSGDTVLTQWFERARFEWHPEQSDPQYRVLLGLLGTEQRAGLVRAQNPGLPGRLLIGSTGGVYDLKADGTRATPVQIQSDQVGSWTPSRNYQYVAYRCTANGGTGLCISNIDGKGQIRLNSDPNSTPLAWSPDNTSIAYVSGTDGRRGLYVIRVNGQGDTLLMVGAPDLVQSSPSWSPDGTRLVFNTNYSENAVYVVNRDGTGLRKIAAQGEQAQWAPSGERIVFQGSSTGNPEIFAINADGSGLAQLTTTPDAESAPRWSPDGTHIAYRVIKQAEPSPAPAPSSIGIMTPDGNTRREVLHVEGAYTTFQFAWSPNSQYVAASRACSRLCGPAQVWGAKVDGSREFLMVTSALPGGAATLIDWLPD